MAGIARQKVPGVTERPVGSPGGRGAIGGGGFGNSGSVSRIFVRSVNSSEKDMIKVRKGLVKCPREKRQKGKWAL